MKLSHNERVRLTELRKLDDANRNYMGSLNNYASAMKVTTENLVAKGLAEYRHRKLAKTGRVMAVGTAHITDAGRDALQAAEA